MAELENSCCTPAAQASCCDPSEKASCCGESHGDACGCAAGSTSAPAGTATAVAEQVRETVREKYAAAARAAATGAGAGCRSPADESGVFGSSLYEQTKESDPADAAVSASLGCGVPAAVADLPGPAVDRLGRRAGSALSRSRRHRSREQGVSPCSCRPSSRRPGRSPHGAASARRGRRRWRPRGGW